MIMKSILKTQNLIRLLVPFVVLSVHEVCGAKGLISASPEDLEMNGLSSSSSSGNSKGGSDTRHSSYNTGNVGGTKQRYSTQQMTNSLGPAPPPPLPLSAYSNLNSQYYNGLGGYNSIPATNSYRYNNYMYNDPYERSARDYNPASSMMNNYSPVSNFAESIDNIDTVVPDYLAAATNSGGHKSGGGGHGQSHGGHGWGWGQQHKQALDTGLGLLGLLGLLSLLQGVLAAFATTTTTAAAGRSFGIELQRNKRQVLINRDAHTENDRIDSDQLTSTILPYLNVVAHARQGTVSMNCTQRQICFVNKILREQLGESGKIIGQKMSEAMKDLLLQRYSSTRSMSPMNSTIIATTEEITSSVALASKDGLAKLNCDILYPTCNEMKHPNGTISHPPLLLTENMVV